QAILRKLTPTTNGSNLTSLKKAPPSINKQFTAGVADGQSQKIPQGLRLSVGTPPLALLATSIADGANCSYTAGRYSADRLEMLRKFLGGPKIHLIIAASKPHVFEPH
ncbi:MAG: hypothetical protein WCO86_19650, partial [Planctomycetota bacterium]